MPSKYLDHPHRRYNILTGEWVLVSPHRAKRPWQGQFEKILPESTPQYDPNCYLCPGNSRAGGNKNPEYKGTFVFDNDFSALYCDTSSEEFNHNDLLISRGEPGICRVVCFSPRHDLTLPEMEKDEIRNIVDVWCQQYEELGSHPKINHVQIFENKGSVMGCSNPHPHGQIWAQESIPMETAKELEHMKTYFKVNNRCIMCEYMEVELSVKERIIIQNEDFVVLVPFWSVWPFETLVLSKRHYASLLEMMEKEKDSLADIIKGITVRYDNLFLTSFPYSAGFHQSPTDGIHYPEYHFHMHFYPPLLRSDTVKKFMVGYEMLANPQRDLTPEQAAERLLNLSDIHYKKKNN